MGETASGHIAQEIQTERRLVGDIFRSIVPEIHAMQYYFDNAGAKVNGSLDAWCDGSFAANAIRITAALAKIRGMERAEQEYKLDKLLGSE